MAYRAGPITIMACILIFFPEQALLGLGLLEAFNMKIKALTRAPSSVQAPGSDVSRMPRNLDPALHPFERARE